MGEVRVKEGEVGSSSVGCRWLGVSLNPRHKRLHLRERVKFHSKRKKRKHTSEI